ncbi:FAD-dependent oxidoreductase [Streptomyces sp. NPDC051172]|uniref:NAD(P)/FAD-dependent oxidoreductase n=1 Tax=Streptomyces sp. NPDC051172 TaxID=3155796 RepID=UPI00341D7F5F
MSHVVILGGGLAGTLAAAAVAPYMDKVTVLERDALSSGPAARPGVPQARHSHMLWSGGAQAVESLVPGTIERLLVTGARKIQMTADAAWLAGSGWLRRTPGRHYVITCSRDLLDWVLREQALLTAPEISLRTRTQAIGLVGSSQRVTGVSVRDHVTGATETLHADLVVDATGRTSKAGHWLTELGLTAIPETVVNWRAGYASRRFRAPSNMDRAFPLVLIQPDFLTTGPVRAAGVWPIEEGQWQVTLLGAHGGEPDARQKRQEGFAAFARSARHPLVADLIAHAEPLGPVHLVRHMRWRRRHCTGLAHRWPDGFAVLGDAAATFNPVLAQGMAVAALSAVALREQLHHGHQPAFSRRLQQAIDRTTRRAWTTGQVLNLLYLAPKPSLAVRLIRRCAVRAFDASSDWPVLHNALYDVLSSSAPITTVLAPRPVLAGIWGRRR